jgi:hypothetical protein
MATQYEILLQKDLERSRRNPVDDYSAGLVDLARYQAQQRFIQQQQAEQQLFAERQAASHLAGQKEIISSTQRAAAEIEAAREKGAMERTQEEGRSRIKVAEIAEQARGRVQSDREKQALIGDFLELGITRKKDETDDQYIERAQPKAIEIRAGHLVREDRRAQGYVNQINDIAKEAAGTYAQRLSDYAWQRVLATEQDPKRRSQLAAAKTPAERDAILAQLKGDAGRTLRTTYDLEHDTAATKGAVTFLEPRQQIEVKRLEAQSSAASKAFEVLISRPGYASAIPEYSRQIGEDMPSDIGGGGKGKGEGALDFSKSAKPGAAGAAAPTKAGAPAAAGAPATLRTPAEVMPFGLEVKQRGLIPALWNARSALSVRPSDIAGRVGSNLASAGEFLFGPGIPLALSVGDLGGADQDVPPLFSAVNPPAPRAMPAAVIPGLGTAAGNAAFGAEDMASVNRTVPVPAEIGPMMGYMRAAPSFGLIGGPPPSTVRLSPSPAEVALTAPAPEVMNARAVRAARLRQAIRLKYPDLERGLNLDVVPVEDLQRIYNEREIQRTGGGGAGLPFDVWPPRAGPVIDVPSEIVR